MFNTNGKSTAMGRCRKSGEEEDEAKTEDTEEGIEEWENKPKKGNPHCHFQCDYEWCKQVRYFGESRYGKGKGKGNRAEKIDKIEGQELTQHGDTSIFPGPLEEDTMPKATPANQTPGGKGDFGYKRPGEQRVRGVATGPNGCTPYLYGGISASDY